MRSFKFEFNCYTKCIYLPINVPHIPCKNTITKGVIHGLKNG